MNPKEVEKEEKYRAWYTDYYAKNKEKYTENSRRYRLANLDKVRAYRREYYQKRKAEIVQYNTQWRRDHRPVKEVKPPKEKPAPKPKKSPANNKTPQPVPEQLPFGTPEEHHKRKKLLETCPLGFYQPPPSQNPFLMTF